jgi:hypothetical protein
MLSRVLGVAARSRKSLVLPHADMLSSFDGACGCWAAGDAKADLGAGIVGCAAGSAAADGDCVLLAGSGIPYRRLLYMSTDGLGCGVLCLDTSKEKRLAAAAADGRDCGMSKEYRPAAADPRVTESAVSSRKRLQ